MESHGRIITIGLSPAWDVSCRGRNLDWGRHAPIDEQVVRPAGKALNVSYALAWLGRPSIAAGLWGREDYGRMKAAVARLDGRITVQMTTAEGATRQNITVVDTRRRREMHLRQKSELASERALRRLNSDLRKLVRRGDTCVFAGAMPGGDLVERFLDLVRTCRKARARIVVDTYGPALAAVVDEGLASMISPNVEELRGLLGRGVANNPARLASAARRLLSKVDTVLVSRGAAGAVIVTKDGTWTGRAATRHKVLSTVGCGDYLLAGFLAGRRQTAKPRIALATGLKLAAARAWDWTESRTWPQASAHIAVSVEAVRRIQ